MNNTQGTPKNLDEAILRGITWSVKPPGADPVSRVKEHLRDWLAQRFAVAYLKARGNQQAIDILDELWKESTK